MVKGRVTNRQATYITDLLNGYDVAEIAKMHNITPSCVSKVIRRSLDGKCQGIQIMDITTSVYREILKKYEEQ